MELVADAVGGEQSADDVQAVIPVCICPSRTLRVVSPRNNCGQRRRSLQMPVFASVVETFVSRFAVTDASRYIDTGDSRRGVGVYESRL